MDLVKKRKGLIFILFIIGATIAFIYIFAVLISSKLFVQTKAIEQAKQLEVVSGAQLLGELKTGYPDGRPGGGVVYRVDSQPDAILEHYLATTSNSGWTLDESFLKNDNDPLFYQNHTKDNWKMRIIVRPDNELCKVTILVYK
jgi:hypothetical protein